MNRSGLIIRLSLVIAFSSVAIGFLSTQLFYRITYVKNLDLAKHNISQLHLTVSSTSAIAAYLEDKEIAKEVVHGLSENEIVEGASMHIGEQVISSFSTESAVQDSPVSFPIFSPFEKSKQVGFLYIYPNLKYIKSQAKVTGRNNAKAMIAQAFLVTLVAIFITYFLITKPMVKIAKSLHTTLPGSKDRLSIPEFHKNSELGGLVRDVNNLLEKTESQFSEERKLRLEIEMLEKRFRMIFENSLSPIVLMEPRGDILLSNRSFEVLLDKLDYKYKKSFGPLLEQIFLDTKKLHKSVQNSLSNEEIATGEYKLVSEDESKSIWVQVVISLIVSDDMKEYHQITLHDISKRKKELDELAYQADFDQLTKLYNRHGMEKIIQTKIDEANEFAIVMIDLNGFKQINDVYGHESGDEILIYVSDKIKKSIRVDDFASRWGGDEFVLLLDNINVEDVRVLTDRIVERISKHYYLRSFGENVSVGASMGAAFYPSDDKNIQGLLRKSDNAMYAVKKSREDKPNFSMLFFSDLENSELNSNFIGQTKQ